MIKVIGVRVPQCRKGILLRSGADGNQDGRSCDAWRPPAGSEFGEVVLGVREVDEKKVIQPLKSVIRMATKNDEEPGTEE